MATLQDIKRRIRSVRNTRKITKAMELVASARLRRAQARMEAVRPYADRMMELMIGTARAVPTISSIIRSAYGRIASILASALRSFAAATSSIAFVILRVLRTDRIRRLRSWSVAIYATSDSSSLTAKPCLNFSIWPFSFSASSSGRSPVSRISL